MGNGSRREIAHLNAARAKKSAIAASQAEIDAKYPPLERPCGTPGATYSIIVERSVLGCTVELPFDIGTSLPADAKEKMKGELHDAILPIIETFYRRVWDKTIAGKKIDGDVMPERWEYLFTTWIRRFLERGERGRNINNEFTLYTKYNVPERYLPDYTELRFWPNGYEG